MIRFFVTLAIVAALVFLGATVKMGKRTFFGHIGAIWGTKEAKDMREGVGDKAGPALNKLERGVKAGVREVTKDEPAGGSAAHRDAGPSPATP